MTMGKPKDKKAGLTMMSAFKYFLKGNMLFALNGTVLIAIDSVICLFPPLYIPTISSRRRILSGLRHC